jgi:hypothetical protein
MADPTMPRQPRGEPACGLHARMSHASSTTSTTVRQARTMMGSTAGVLRGVTGAKLTILPARLAACWTWARGFPRLAGMTTRDGETSPAAKRRGRDDPAAQEDTRGPRGQRATRGDRPRSKGGHCPTRMRLDSRWAGIEKTKRPGSRCQKKPGKLVYSAASMASLAI